MKRDLGFGRAGLKIAKVGTSHVNRAEIHCRLWCEKWGGTLEIVIIMHLILRVGRMDKRH